MYVRLDLGQDDVELTLDVGQGVLNDLDLILLNVGVGGRMK